MIKFRFLWPVVYVVIEAVCLLLSGPLCMQQQQHLTQQCKLKACRHDWKIMKRLEGKVAVITGGSSGIGLATAQRFVEESAYVFITGRRQGELDAAVRQIGKNVTGVQGDVSNLEDLDRLYAKVREHKGHIDILFANAGIAYSAPLGEISEAHFDKVFGVNVRGLLFSVQKALPLFQEGVGGSIILNASVASSKGFGCQPFTAQPRPRCGLLPEPGRLT